MNCRGPLHKQRWAWDVGMGLWVFALMEFALPALSDEPIDVPWIVIPAVAAIVWAIVSRRIPADEAFATARLEASPRRRRVCVSSFSSGWLERSDSGRRPAEADSASTG